MAFTKPLSLNLFKAHSSRILASFTKTKVELLKLNEELENSINTNNNTIASLNNENSVMNNLKIQHEKIVSNINSFLSVDNE